MSISNSSPKGLAATCRGQGLGFSQIAVQEPAATLQDTFKQLEALSTTSSVLVCHDGRGLSAAAAVAWLTLHCGQALDASIEAVIGSASQVGATRMPLEAFETREAFTAALSKAGIEATVGVNSRQIGYILNVGGCVTPAIFAALTEALAEQSKNETSEEEGQNQGDEEQLVGSTASSLKEKPGRQVYTQNGVTTLALSMDDYGRTELTEAFQQRCFDFIARGLEDGSNVLVHCRLGVNRSVTVVIGYLMRRCNFSFDRALELVRRKRHCAQPNDAYCAQLRQLEPPQRV
eukprot:symbB.v1.2.030213.t1/scaffold3382.1/size60170/1